MTDAPELPETPRAADERTTLLTMLDYYRAVLIRKTCGLSDEQLATPLHVSDLTLGGLVLHMALVEDNWFDHRFRGNDPREPWASAPWAEDSDWEFHNVSDWTHTELLAQFETSVARSRAVIAATEHLDDVATRRQRDGSGWSMRWILVHMIEEYARHCGHADYLRESLDGATGD